MRFENGKFVDDYAKWGDSVPEVLSTIGEYIVGSPYFIRTGLGAHSYKYNVWTILDGDLPIMIAEFPEEQMAIDYAIWRSAVNQTESEGKLDLGKLATEMGGKLDTVSGPLPDGSGFATMSFPLPKDHWLTRDDRSEEPPMPFRKGVDEPERKEWVEKLREAARWAIKASTDNGKIDDFDPDAMVTNFVIACVGFWTEDGRGSS